MRRATSTARIGGPALVAALVCITSLLWPDRARSDTPFYEVTVPLGGPTEEDRARAFAEALQAVAVKASGRRGAATNRTVLAANPARYVQRYAKTADQMLKVGFAGTAVEELLQQAGLPLWPTERPVTAVTVTGADRTEARGSVQDGVDLAADTLAAYYAPPSTRSTSSLSISVGGMRDLTAYAALVRYLRSLSMVRDLSVEALTGDVVRLRLTIQGDRQSLVRIAALDGRLQAAARSTDPADAGVDFLFQP
jgi:hypothetical protein